MVSEQADKLLSIKIENMPTNKYESIKIPVLKKSEYVTWKVKIMMYLKASDLDYHDRIFDGLYVPKKLVPQVNGVPEHYVGKTKSEMTHPRSRRNVSRMPRSELFSIRI